MEEHNMKETENETQYAQQDENINQQPDGSIKREVISWIKTLVIAAIFAALINTFVMVNASVPTGSMENTIMPGDRIMAFRLAFVSKHPERFDIVVFKFPDDESTLYVKRIIGLPGEEVVIKDGKVYINGNTTPLDDSFVKSTPLGDFGPYNVPEGHYFMLGDNRNNSADSRMWYNTYLSEDKILGKAIFKYYPGFEMLTDK